MLNIWIMLILVVGVACALMIKLRGCGMIVIKRVPQHILSPGIGALCIVLASCGSSQGTASPTATSVRKTVTAVVTATSTSASTAAQKSTDWTTYHRDSMRTGYVADAPDPQQLTPGWTAKLDGAVYAEPLVVGGSVIVATENDTLYALDSTSGNVQWRTNVGQPVAQSTLPCGDIDPLGITGTPVYDPATGLVFAVAEVSGPHHILAGVDVTNGSVRINRSVDIPAMEPATHQQRAALLLSNGMIYVAYGGLAGDCGNYHGTVIATRTDGQGQLLSYQVPTPREGGIWAPSGPAVDAAGKVYVAVGNGETTSGNWDHSDSVLRLSSTLQLEDAFAPSEWQQENSNDTDLGSMGPTLLPGGLVFIAGKSGKGYLLHANSLGGVGGQIAQIQICNGPTRGGTASTGTQVFVPCVDGLRAVNIGSGATMSVAWQAQATMPPIVGGHTVYSLDPDGTLSAFAIDSGALRAKTDLGQSVPTFSTPTLSANHLFVPTKTGVMVVTIS